MLLPERNKLMSTYQITDLETHKNEIVEAFSLSQANDLAKKLYRYYTLEKTAYKTATINRWNTNRGFN